MGWEFFDVVRFDLEPLLQGHSRTAKLKRAYNSFIIDPGGLQCETNLQDIVGWESSDVRSYFKVRQWFTGFGELSFRWIQICKLTMWDLMLFSDGRKASGQRLRKIDL